MLRDMPLSVFWGWQAYYRQQQGSEKMAATVQDPEQAAAILKRALGG